MRNQKPNMFSSTVQWIEQQIFALIILIVLNWLWSTMLSLYKGFYGTCHSSPRTPNANYSLRIKSPQKWLFGRKPEVREKSSIFVFRYFLLIFSINLIWYCNTLLYSVATSILILTGLCHASMFEFHGLPKLYMMESLPRRHNNGLRNVEEQRKSNWKWMISAPYKYTHYGSCNLCSPINNPLKEPFAQKNTPKI